VDGPSPLNVLVVENDADIRETLKEFLEDQGHVVWCALSGEAALEGLRRGRRTDVILVDFQLEGMNGIELLDFCGADAQLSRLSMVLMTGFPPEQLRAGLRCRILGKPFGLEQVLEALTLALSGGHMPFPPVPGRLLEGSV
jgi:CheY-like chemotaxis protein